MGDLLVLWDVDGTLLNAGGVGGDLYEMVFSSMFGRPCGRLAPMAGRTDRAIILDTLEMAGIAEPRRHVDRFIEGLRAHSPAMFEAARRQGRALPGAAEALRAVATARVGTSTIGFAAGSTALADPGRAAGDRAPAADEPPGGAAGIPVSFIPAPARVAAGTVPAGASVGAAAVPLATSADAQSPSTVLSLAAGAETASFPVAAPQVQVAPHRRRRPESGRVYQSVLTGNMRTLAEVKLSAVGLRYPLDLCIGAYGDDHEVRAELVHLARRRACAVHGRPLSDFSGRATVVIGDTPLDIEAALVAGARAVGVATGGHPASALREAGAHAVLTDLTNTAIVLSALLA